MQQANDNLAPSLLERIEGALERGRERVPNLTTGLLVAVLLIGATVGALASKPVHRWQINKEWRASIASKSAAVRKLLEESNAEVEAVDNAIIATLGITDERLAVAEQGLENAINAPAIAGECRIPSSSLR